MGRMGWQKTSTATSSLLTPTISRSQPRSSPLLSPLLPSVLSPVLSSLCSPLLSCLYTCFGVRVSGKRVGRGSGLWYPSWHVSGMCVACVWHVCGMTAVCVMTAMPGTPHHSHAAQPRRSNGRGACAGGPPPTPCVSVPSVFLPCPASPLPRLSYALFFLILVVLLSLPLSLSLSLHPSLLASLTPWDPASLCVRRSC